MLMVMRLLLPLAAAAAAVPSLPVPTRLMVEHLHAPSKPGGLLTISASRPRFSFLPHAQHSHPGAGVEMSAYRIVVHSMTPAGGGWDSGVVNASAAVGVRCGVDLRSA